MLKTNRAHVGVAAVLLIGLFAFPFLTASMPCAWRLSAYTYAGLAVLVAVALMLFVPTAGRHKASRFTTAFFLVSLCLVVWLTGFIAADVRIVCRLF